jgi:hypothetical protein
MSQYPLPLLPLQHEVESKVVLKKLALAHKALAELNGVAETIPNEVIILNNSLYRKQKTVRPLKTSLQRTMNYLVVII